MAGAGAAARFVLKDIVDGRARRGDCGNETEEQRGEQRNEAEEGQHRETDARGAEIGHGEKLRFGNGGEQQSDAPLRGDEADGGTDEREHQAFGEELRSEIDSRGAHGRAHGEFLAASDRAREEQIGDVGAGDKQNEADCTEQNEKQRANFADDAFTKRTEHNGDGVVFFRIGVRELSGDARHLRFCLIGRDTLCQAAEDIEPAKAAPLSELT